MYSCTSMFWGRSLQNNKYSVFFQIMYMHARVLTYGMIRGHDKNRVKSREDVEVDSGRPLWSHEVQE